MNMPQVTGLSLILLLAAKPGAAWASEDASLAPQEKPVAHAPKAPLGPAEYKRGDAKFYPKAEFLKARPTAVIIQKSQYTQTGDSYFFTPKIRAPKEIFAEVANDWIEPITPPDMPASLGVPPDAMQIREPQGDVEVALPSAPATFVAVTGNTALPNGAVVKTGANGTAAILFGGVDSARLMPDSAAAVQQTVTPNTRTAEVDLTTGGVFSKVGTQVGVTGTYEVHTPSGNAISQGGDFATIIASTRADVWVAQGTVNLVNPSENKNTVSVTADGTGSLKILRSAAFADPHQALAADVETLTAALNFIPLANQKVRGLREKQSNGTPLTDNEKAYLGQIKQVTALIKLDLAPKPIPAPTPVAPPVQPIVTTPAPRLEIPAPATPAPDGEAPIPVDVRADGTIALSGETVTPEALESALAGIAKVNPTQPIIITGRATAKHELFRKVLAICKASKLKVTVENTAPANAKPVETVSPPSPAASVPPPAPAPVVPPEPSPAPAAPAPAPDSVVSAPPVIAPSGPPPIRAVVRTDGKINFQGATLTPDEFRKALEKLVLATPDQELLVRAGKTVPYDKLKAVLDICHDTNAKYELSAAPRPADGATPTTEPSTSNLPAPALLMHPSTEAPTTNPAPEAPPPAVP
jgi:biopolymer transport protein ExbD